MENDEKGKTIKEKKLKGSPEIILYECHKKIGIQMENCICKIKAGDGFGTGFFCQLNHKLKDGQLITLHVLITNNHIIDKKFISSDNSEISIKIEGINEPKSINLKNRKTFTDKEPDITIIELKDSDEIKIKDYLKLDDPLLNNIESNQFKEETYIYYESNNLYVIQYPNGNLGVSYGYLKEINKKTKNKLYHTCNTIKGSSGSPILNLSNNKVIGLHSGSKGDLNEGIFLDIWLKKYIDEKYENKNEKLIIQFNDKYGVKLNENDNDINLNMKSIGDNGFKYLSNIKFKEIKSLNLYENKISDLNHLINLNNGNILEKLINLRLTNNNISDISPLTLIHFNSLEYLWINDNNIIDISPLEKMKCQNLLELGLNHNRIRSIDVFEKVYFPKLEKLDLKGNEIIDLKILEKVEFKNLKKLDLSKNREKIDENNPTIIKLKNKNNLDIFC